MNRRTRKVLFSGLLAASLGAALAATPLLSTGCYGHICDPSTVPYGLGPDEGDLINENTWESTKQTSTWIPYPGKRTLALTPKGLEGRGVLRVLVYISPDAVPNDGNHQYTLAAGNLGEISIAADRVSVINDTCADYFARVVIEAYPAPNAADAGSGDGADTSSDASVADTSSDASAE